MKYVYVHSKGYAWNSEGRMDYLLGTVQKVSLIEDNGNIHIHDPKRDHEIYDHWTILSGDYSEAVPNNPLSRIIYPSWKVTKCGGFLYEI